MPLQIAKRPQGPGPGTLSGRVLSGRGQAWSEYRWLPITQCNTQCYTTQLVQPALAALKVELYGVSGRMLSSV